MPEKKKIVAVLNDLLFTVKIQDAAKRAGLEPVFVKSQQHVLDQAKNKPALIILDLNYAEAAPLEIIEKLKLDKESSDIPLLGFVSHVQADLKQAAQEKGCDAVLPRSAFAQNLPRILLRYAAVGV